MVSVYKCDVHGARIRGALEGLRVTILKGRVRYSRKLRVCPLDLDSLLDEEKGRWGLLSESVLDAPDELQFSCGHLSPDGPIDSHLFAYVWRRGQPEAEYYADLCAKCCAGYVDRLGLIEEAQ